MCLRGKRMPHVVAWMSFALAMAVGATLLYLQIRTYRLTRHRSLLVVAFSQAAGLIYGVMSVAPAFIPGAPETKWAVYYSAHMFFLIQCVVGIVGAVWFFNAFVALSANVEQSAVNSGTPPQARDSSNQGP